MWFIEIYECTSNWAWRPMPCKVLIHRDVTTDQLKRKELPIQSIKHTWTKEDEFVSEICKSVTQDFLAPSIRKEISCHFFSATTESRKHLNTMGVNCFDHFTLKFHDYQSHILPIWNNPLCVHRKFLDARDPHEINNQNGGWRKVKLKSLNVEINKKIISCDLVPCFQNQIHFQALCDAKKLIVMLRKHNTLLVYCW